MDELIALDDADSKELFAQNEQLRNDQLKQSEELRSSSYKPIIIVGPSGVGKSTLISKLTEKHPNKFGFSVSYTTRAPRAGEEHGKSYFFVTKEEFQAMIDKDDFIEWCQVETKQALMENGVDSNYAIFYVFLIYTPILILFSWLLEWAVDAPSKRFSSAVDIESRNDGK